MTWLRERWRHMDRSDRWLALPSTVIGAVGVVALWLDVPGAGWLIAPMFALMAVWVGFQFIWLRKAKDDLEEITRDIDKLLPPEA